MILTYILLALAILFLWLSGDGHSSQIRRRLWLVIWLSSLAAASISGVITPPGLVITLVFAAATYLYPKTRAAWQIALVAMLILSLSIGLLLHRLPGFHNLRVIDGVQFSPDAIPFTLYLNYDKTLIGLFILGWCHARITRAHEWKNTLTAILPWAAGLITLLMALSLAISFVRFEPKFPAETWLWLGVNLLFTCTAEEAFFRGFVQAQLARLLAKTNYGKILALCVASVLFGLAHFPGGYIYVVLATVAGLGYGWLYQRTQRIEASILTHFALNTTHFFLFTYPALAHGR
jgi:membrane protease YdiL (CAAX protease family)